MIIQGFRPFAPIRPPAALFRQSAGLLGLDRRRQGGRLGLQLCLAHRRRFIVGNGPARRHLPVHADCQLASRGNRPVKIGRDGLNAYPGRADQCEQPSPANHTNAPALEPPSEGRVCRGGRMPQDAIPVTRCRRYADMRAGLNGGGQGADRPTGARVNP
jgi:hypothetical protein